jgi:hypothetical protein
MNDLDCLIQRYMDGIASAEEVENLNQRLRSDRQARQVFIEYLDMDSAAAEISAGVQGKEAAVEDIIQINQRALFSNAIANSIIALAVAATLLVGMWFWLANPTKQSTTYPRVAARPDQKTIIPREAVLIDEAYAVFARGFSPQDKNLAPGDYHLLDGYAHIRFALGAELVLHGPAKWSIFDAMHVRFDYGKVRVIVPPSAKGFSIATPDADYVDLGTEFGLDVDPQENASDLYVFDGQVNIEDKSSKELLEEVLEGNSKRLKDGLMEAAPKIDFMDFPTPNQIGLVRWKSNLDRLKKDPGLIGFFPFRKIADEGKLVNEVRDVDLPIPDGRIVGARWVSGRWTGKDSLLFDGDEDRVELTIPGEFEEYTIATWIKIDRLDYERNAILNSDQLEAGDVHFQITRQGLPKGGVQGQMPGATTDDTFIGDPLPIGKWVHLAMVISSPDRIRNIYANGKLVRSAVMNHSVTIRPENCRLGNWLPSITVGENRKRAFRGRIDELAIWNRALVEAELRSLTEAGRPYEPSSQQP